MKTAMKATHNRPCRKLTVLQEADVRRLQDDTIQQLSSTLSLSKDEAIKLLYHYRWNDLLLDEWFADEERVRAKVGLLNRRTIFCCQGQLTTCGICFESFPLDHHHYYPTACGHSYCVSINDGPGCLSLGCPEPKCKSNVVDQDMIDKLASDEEKRKYACYLFRSYVEENNKMKWCPAPGCENAMEFEKGDKVYDVTCLCSNAFCWNCVEEVHRPMDCKTVAKWVLKNSSESKNTAWNLANSKACPKCNQSIEKNQGCMHMTCRQPCSFQLHMGIIFLRIKLPRDPCLSTCKVRQKLALRGCINVQNSNFEVMGKQGTVFKEQFPISN